MTAYGTVFVGMAYPVYCSIWALEVSPRLGPNTIVKLDPDTPRTPVPAARKVRRHALDAGDRRV